MDEYGIFEYRVRCFAISNSSHVKMKNPSAYPCYIISVFTFHLSFFFFFKKFLWLLDIAYNQTNLDLLWSQMPNYGFPRATAHFIIAGNICLPSRPYTFKLQLTFVLAYHYNHGLKTVVLDILNG